MTRRQSIGREAEDRAAELLQRHGLCLVARNYRCRGGEVDLIMRDGSILVFVEVRYRRADRFGGALESIDGLKQQRLALAATHYLGNSGVDCPCRFDVVTARPARDDMQLDWIRDAFRAD